MPQPGMATLSHMKILFSVFSCDCSSQAQIWLPACVWFFFLIVSQPARIIYAVDMLNVKIIRDWVSVYAM
jgi:hypothetical protein